MAQPRTYEEIVRAFRAAVANPAMVVIETNLTHPNVQYLDRNTRTLIEGAVVAIEANARATAGTPIGERPTLYSGLTLTREAMTDTRLAAAGSMSLDFARLQTALTKAQGRR